MPDWILKGNVLSPRSTPSDSDRLKQKVREGLEVVQKAIKDEFGLKLNIGAELECNIFPSDRTSAEYLETSSTPAAHDPLHIYLSKTSEYLPAYFPKVPHLLHVYKEPGNYQYEIVFSPAQDALEISDSVIQIKADLPPVLGRRHMRVGFHPMGIDEGQKRNDYTNGMHWNISLATDTNPNLFTSPSRITVNSHGPRPPQTPQENACEELIDSCLPTLDETTLMFAPQTSSYKRLKEGIPGTPPYEMANNGERGGAIRGKYKHLGKERMECRLSGSDADPHQSLLALMTALYISLKENKASVVDDSLFIEAPQGKSKNLGHISGTIEDALDKFKSGNRFRSTLNHLSAGLGDDIVQGLSAAAEQHIQAVKARRGF